MYCAQCCEKITCDPVRQGNDLFCSLECAGQAAGIDPEEAIDDFDEFDLADDLFAEDSDV